MLKSTELVDGNIVAGEFKVTFIRDINEKYKPARVKFGIQLKDKTIEAFVDADRVFGELKYGDTVYLRGIISYAPCDDGRSNRPKIFVTNKVFRVFSPEQQQIPIMPATPPEPLVTFEEAKAAALIVRKYKEQQKDNLKKRLKKEEPLLGMEYCYLTDEGYLQHEVWEGNELDYYNLWHQRIQKCR